MTSNDSRLSITQKVIMKFDEFITDPSILRALEELGFENATPIQEKAIPEVMKGVDLRASAQTGTGKTAAFILPALVRLLKASVGANPRVLILVPTRELAMQVAADTAKLSKYLPNLKTVCLYGGVPYPIQNRQLAKKFDILVATPGRLIDHLQQKRVKLSSIEMLILDEADRMLDMGFIEPVEYIASLALPSRQTLMFSATYGKKVMKLAETLLNDPIEVKIEKEMRNHDLIEQHLHRSENLDHKYRLLEHVLAESSYQQAIVFSATKMQTEQIADKLCERGFQAAAMHGDMNQRQRTRTMQQLREGKIRILVATDVAARGIDVQSISHVINFDLPHSLEDYIHRIGRTGRAGSKGFAVSFASPKDHEVRKEIERFTGLKMTSLIIPGFQERIEAPKKNFSQPRPRFNNYRPRKNRG